MKRMPRAMRTHVCTCTATFSVEEKTASPRYQISPAACQCQPDFTAFALQFLIWKRSSSIKKAGVPCQASQQHSVSKREDQDTYQDQPSISFAMKSFLAAHKMLQDCLLAKIVSKAQPYCRITSSGLKIAVHIRQ
jgi:hypothetical protein